MIFYMVCPACQKELIPLRAKDKNGQDLTVNGCPFCGGFWLTYFQANEISLSSAQNLTTQLPKGKDLTKVSDSLLCPNCQVNLETQRGESIPLNCLIYRCPNCSGNWFPKGELLKFKKAQKAKLNYFKIWQIPLDSPFSILLPLLIIAFVGLSIPATVYLVKKNQEQRTLALELVKNVSVYQIDQKSVLITWQTAKPLKSEVEFGKTRFFGQKFLVSETPTTLHQVKIKDLTSGSRYYYRILIIQDQKRLALPISSFVKE